MTNPDPPGPIHKTKSPRIYGPSGEGSAGHTNWFLDVAIVIRPHTYIFCMEGVAITPAGST